MNNIFFYETEIGKIGIAESGKAVTNLYFHEDEIPGDATVNETELLKEAGKQLHSYLAGKQKEFSLPLAPRHRFHAACLESIASNSIW